MDLGKLVVETNGPRAQVIMAGGFFLVACGALGFFEPIAFAFAAPGIAVIAHSARRPKIRIHERGVISGSRRMDYGRIRSIQDEHYMREAVDPDVVAGSPAAAALLSQVDAYITLSDGSPFSVIRLQRTAQIEEALAQHILPVAVAAWRKKLDAGESYKIPNSIVELKSHECWAPSGRRYPQPVLLPFRDTRIEGSYAFREGNPQPVAFHAALGHDLLFRALLRSYGIRVDGHRNAA